MAARIGTPAGDVVEAVRLSKRYGDTAALADVSFAVRAGETFGVLGQNGAGKSTLLETLVGLRRPTDGTIRVFGVDPAADRPATTARVSVQPQAAALPSALTVLETVRMFAALHRAPRPVGGVVDEVGLTDSLHVRAGDLSGGQLRRLLLAVALVGDPELVVLDEPSAGLDPAARAGLHGVVRALGERGVTVVCSTHDMQEATELCDRVMVIDGGRVVALDRPDQLVHANSELSAVSFTVDADEQLRWLRFSKLAAGVVVEPLDDGQRVTVTTADPDGVLRAVIERPGLRSRAYDVRRGSLHDVFLALVGAGTAGRA